MKPKKNRIFCRDCNKYKTLFESESKADNFIKFNHEEIEACSGHAPNRSYYCRSCVGWHVTSKKEYDDRLPSLTDKVLDAYKATLPMKLLSGDRALLRRADEIMADIAKLIKEKNPEQCVSLFQEVYSIFQRIPDTDDIIKYKQSLFLRYRKLITKIDRGMLDTFIIPVSTMQSLAAESNLKELKMQYDMGNYEVANELLQDVRNAVANVVDEQYKKELNKRIKIIGTKNNLRMGIEAIEQMQNPDKNILFEEIEENFIKIDLSYVYGEYHECVKLIQYVKRIYDVVLTIEGSEARKKKIEDRLHKFVESVSIALKAL